MAEIVIRQLISIALSALLVMITLFLGGGTNQHLTKAKLNASLRLGMSPSETASALGLPPPKLEVTSTGTAYMNLATVGYSRLLWAQHSARAIFEANQLSSCTLNEQFGIDESEETLMLK